MLIVGVDPGKKTGCASYDTSVRRLLGAHELPHEEFLDAWVPWLDDLPPHTDLLLVVERFIITAGTTRKSRTDENWSIEQIGVLRHHARWNDHRFELQSAGDAKRFAPNVRLKQIGWHIPGRDHANDALRHVLLAVARHDPATLAHLLDDSLRTDPHG